tara:strand:- start:1230 stop:2717 length:1488 start_codon:yes stop_codon:yes gene_type:complete
MKRIKRLVIVGGGTAGWIAASWFARRWGKIFEVVVIDKSAPERVGVGEATLLSFPNVMKQMGYKPTDWIKEIDATLKSGILFPGWGVEDQTIWHPFSFTSVGDSKTPLYDMWQSFQDEYDIKKISPMYNSSLANRIETEYTHDSYAFQIDCGKLVKFLQKNTIPYLKEYIQSDVVDIYRDGNADDITRSNIKELVLDDGSKITGDLFIDCTGWKQMLIGQRNVDCSDRLFINAALAAKVDYKDPKEQHPYTACPAQEHGWIWKIPTRYRIGTGYCFNQDVNDPEEVAQAFSDQWDGRIKPKDMRLLDWKPQYSKNFWDGNVISIGLSAGFIEPLESTGLAMMIRGVEYLDESIYGGSWNKKTDPAFYNEKMRSSFETAVDYISMHYSYCRRKGKFWDFVRSKYKKTSSQLYYEEMIQDPEVQTPQTGKTGSFFDGSNWQVWLLQLMTDKINSKEYWKKDDSCIPRLRNFVNNTLPANQGNSVPHGEYISHIYTLK